MGKRTLSFRRSIIRRRTMKPGETPLLPGPGEYAGTQSPNEIANNSISAMVAASSKPKKKVGGARLWMRFDKLGQSELIECEKSLIVKRVSIPTRDLRVLLGPVFSHSSNILAREKAVIVNLEFIKAIVTAEEVLLLDPLRQEVLPFVDQLRLQLPQKSPRKMDGAGQLAVSDIYGLFILDKEIDPESAI